jgi:predicted DNA-binding transcriptional regulator AlpA
MNVEALFAEIRAIRVDMLKLLGTRLTNEAFAARLGVTRRTLYNRIQAGTVPRPGPEGTWFLHEVIEWEAKS